MGSEKCKVLWGHMKDAKKRLEKVFQDIFPG